MMAYQYLQWEKYERRFELARLLGARAEAISQGAPVFVPVHTVQKDALDLALQEWRAGVFPLEITYKYLETLYTTQDQPLVPAMQSLR